MRDLNKPVTLIGDLTMRHNLSQVPGINDFTGLGGDIIDRFAGQRLNGKGMVHWMVYVLEDLERRISLEPVRRVYLYTEVVPNILRGIITDQELAADVVSFWIAALTK